MSATVINIGKDYWEMFLRRSEERKVREYHVSQSVQSLRHVPLFVIPWTAALQASLSTTNSQSLLKLMCIVHPPASVPPVGDGPVRSGLCRISESSESGSLSSINKTETDIHITPHFGKALHQLPAASTFQ